MQLSDITNYNFKRVAIYFVVSFLFGVVGIFFPHFLLTMGKSLTSLMLAYYFVMGVMSLIKDGATGLTSPKLKAAPVEKPVSAKVNHNDVYHLDELGDEHYDYEAQDIEPEFDPTPSKVRAHSESIPAFLLKNNRKQEVKPHNSNRFVSDCV